MICALNYTLSISVWMSFTKRKDEMDDDEGNDDDTIKHINYIKLANFVLFFIVGSFYI